MKRLETAINTMRATAAARSENSAFLGTTQVVFRGRRNLPDIPVKVAADGKRTRCAEGETPDDFTKVVGLNVQLMTPDGELGIEQLISIKEEALQCKADELRSGDILTAETREYETADGTTGVNLFGVQKSGRNHDDISTFMRSAAKYGVAVKF